MKRLWWQLNKPLIIAIEFYHEVSQKYVTPPLLTIQIPNYQKKKKNPNPQHQGLGHINYKKNLLNCQLINSCRVFQS